MKFVWTRIQNVGDNNCKVISLHNRVNSPEGVVLLFLQPREGKSYFSKKKFERVSRISFSIKMSQLKAEDFYQLVGPCGKNTS